MILHGLDLAGVAVFAASGVLAARDRDLDLFGALVVAAITAVGGGTLRDLLLDRHPIFWITDESYLVVILVAALATFARIRVRAAPGATLLVADALGLALFALSGAQLAEAVHLTEGRRTAIAERIQFGRALVDINGGADGIPDDIATGAGRFVDALAIAGGSIIATMKNSGVSPCVRGETFTLTPLTSPTPESPITWVCITAATCGASFITHSVARWKRNVGSFPSRWSGSGARLTVTATAEAHVVDQ